jgi:hypothetical protein
MSIQREFQRQQQGLQEQQQLAEKRGNSSGLGGSGSGSGSGGGGVGASETGGEDGNKQFVSTEAVLQGYAEMRGGSLMQQHLQKQSAKKQAQAAAAQGQPPGRRAFDRERDLLANSKMDEHKVAKLVENAKELDSRFDKAYVQKNFL